MAAARKAKLQAAGGAGRGPAATHEEIARLAYSYWESRGSQAGSAEEDWFRAERELTVRSGRRATMFTPTAK